MSEPIHEVRLRVVQQVTLRIPVADKLDAVELAKRAINKRAEYWIEGQNIPVVDQYVEGVHVMSVEEGSS